MGQMKGQSRIKEAIVGEYLRDEVSLRDLGARHGISSSTLHRWVKAAGRRSEADDLEETSEEGRPEKQVEKQAEKQPENLALEVKRLREGLRRAELHNKLLNAMIDIAEEQFEIPIRKKRGAGQ